MSLSQTLKKYEEALTVSQGRQEALYDSRGKNVASFYGKFLSRLIRRYDANLRDDKWVADLRGKAKKFFGTGDLTFLAVDGTSDKVQLEEYAVFFAASYGVAGTLDKDGQVVYKRRALEDELSLVAYVPIPFAQLGDLTADQADDESRFSMMEIHNALMMLAEIYLIYREATAAESPKVIMWDQSFSGMFHWKSFSLSGVPMVENGYSHNGRQIKRGDLVVVRSHPFNVDLGVPAAAPGYFNVPSRIVFELSRSPGNEVSLSALEQVTGEKTAEIYRVAKEYMADMIDVSASGFKLRPEYTDSWDFVVGLVADLCSKLFKDKDIKSMSYNNRWITTADIDFLTSVLIRKVVETAWERNIFLIGVVKDSGSRYFTHNYLGVMQKAGQYSGYTLDELANLLWTDRLTLESLPFCDDKLDAPWSTIEFDSVFQITFLSTANGAQEVTMRNIPSSERIFARSLALLYSVRRKDNVVFNHMLFVDRPLYPAFDSAKIKKVSIDGHSQDVKTSVSPFMDKDASEDNFGLDFMMYFLNQVTRNRFADVIGYPEPLHKADLGCKSFNKMVQGMIRSSASLAAKDKPWLSSVRQKRRFK